MDALAEALAAIEAAPDTRNVPGHRDAGRDNWHFLNRGCLECDAHALAVAPRDRVEGWYHTGHIGQVWYEAYMWAWSTSHFGRAEDWTPADAETQVRADMIVLAYKGQRAAEERA